MFVTLAKIKKDTFFNPARICNNPAYLIQSPAGFLKNPAGLSLYYARLNFQKNTIKKTTPSGVAAQQKLFFHPAHAHGAFA